MSSAEVVTQHLTSLIAKQVDDYGLVVWYDPDRDYVDVAEGSNCPVRLSCDTMGASYVSVGKSISRS